MKVFSILLSFLVFFNISLSFPLDTQDNKRDLDLLTQLEAGEQLQIIAKRYENELEERDYAVLTEFFKLITETGLAVDIIKILVTNQITEPIVVKAVVWFISTQNLTDLLTAVGKSSLVVDIILRALQDEKFFPGAYNIIDGLKKGQTTTAPDKTIDTISLTQDMSKLASSYNQFASQGLGNVMSDIGDELGIGKSGGLFSFLNPVFSLVGLGTTGLESSDEITLSPSATAAASGVASSTAKASSTTKASSTATAASTSTSAPSATASSSSDSGSGSSSSGSWWNRIVGTVSGWFSKRDFIEEDAKAELSKRDNELLDQLVDSLAKSGLAMQVVVAIVEDSDFAPFARDLIKEIVDQKVITLDELKNSLDATNLLNNGIIEALQSPDLNLDV